MGGEERTGYGREDDGEDAEEDVACAAHFRCDDGCCFGLDGTLVRNDTPELEWLRDHAMG